MNIAVAGTEKHIGVTTQCLLIAQFFNSLGMRACYICGRDEIENLEEFKEVLKKFFTARFVNKNMLNKQNSKTFSFKQKNC